MSRNQKQQKQMEEFARWLRELFIAKQNEDTQAGKVARDEVSFAKRYLGVEYTSYARWREASNPISDINLLLIALNTGSTRPLEIFERREILGDPAIVELIAKWKNMPDERRERIYRLAVEDEEEEAPTHLAQA